MKTPEWIAAPKRRNSLAVRAARLIDVLIDRAHRDWPGTSFVLSCPPVSRFSCRRIGRPDRPAHWVTPATSASEYDPFARWIRPCTRESVP